MIGASLVESAGPLLTVLTPLVAVPLTVITFYLRSLREHQVSWHADLVRRVESVEASVVTVREAVAEFERDYTTKEEWLRECMMARRTLEQLSETTVRIETTMQGLLTSERTRPDAGLTPVGKAVRDQTDAPSRATMTGAGGNG
ncbi:MAG: hypothetical protein IIA55_14520 [Gemmatimonadetes bacterium]|nr:hypothetical protein [Gemmatimonadota bacterium]